MNFIILALIAFAIYYFFIRKTPKKGEKDEVLIQCDKCKTFVPSKEIKKIGTQKLCSECK